MFLKHLFLVTALALPSCAGNAGAANAGKHLFILSGQSNMHGHRPDEAFTPAVVKALGKDRVVVVQDALGGQPIQRWDKQWKSPSGEKPKTTGDLYDQLMSKVTPAIKNDLHYSAEGYKTLGKRFAEKALGLIRTNSK